jgi:tryptophan 2,3-dioxygenase
MPLTTYWEYLKLDQLLALQGGLDDDEARLLPDERHFIIVHQVIELWFKLILGELRAARDALAEGPACPRAAQAALPHLRRAIQTLGIAGDHWRLMETLAPQDFLDFRDKLFPASGFQSFQFPEMEIVLGLEEALGAGQARSLAHIRNWTASSPAAGRAWARIERARGERTFRAALYDWLAAIPIRGSAPGDARDEQTVHAFLASYLGAIRAYQAQQLRQLLGAPHATPADLARKFEDRGRASEEFLFALDVAPDRRARARRLRAALLLVESYRAPGPLAWARELLEAVLELEELLVLWRARHARMAERIIGRRVGTGGSAGVEYLDQTTSLRVFGDLWAARTELLPRHLLPAADGPAGPA